MPQFTRVVAKTTQISTKVPHCSVSEGKREKKKERKKEEEEEEEEEEIAVL